MAISDKTLTLLRKLTVILFPSNKDSATNPVLVWVINLYKGEQFCFAIALETARLKSILKNNKYFSVTGGDSNTSSGFLLPLKDLLDINNYENN